jgi:hypothetical protein
MNEMPAFYDVANGELHTAVLLRHAIEKGLRFHAHAEWCSDLSTLAELGEAIGGDLLYDSRYTHRQTQVYDLGATVVQIVVNRPRDSTPSVYVDVWCVSRQAVDLENREVEAAAAGNSWPTLATC